MAVTFWLSRTASPSRSARRSDSSSAYKRRRRLSLSLQLAPYLSPPGSPFTVTLEGVGRLEVDTSSILQATLEGAGDIEAHGFTSTPAGTTGLQLEDDTITLGGQVFPIRALARGNAVSEFETGVKIGPATNDQREHAFYLTMDDFSGGFGHRHMQRDELGTFWDVNPENAPDLSRAGHMTLPPYQKDIELTNSIRTVDTSFMHPDFPWTPDVQSIYASDGVFAIGDSVFVTSAFSTTEEPRLLYSASGWQIGSLLSVIDDNGNHKLFIAVMNQGINADIGFHPNYAVSSGLFTVRGPSVFHIGNINAAHAIWWDNKIIAVSSSYNGIIFGIFVDGILEWNVEDEADGEVIVHVNTFTTRFAGIAPAPWGEQAVYVYDERHLYVLDFYARKLQPIDLGIVDHIEHAIVHNGSIAITDGWNVYLYDTGGNTARRIGLPAEHGGIAPSIAPQDSSFFGAGVGRGIIRYLATAGTHLFAAVVRGPGIETWVMRYNGLGWAQVGGRYDFVPYSFFVLEGSDYVKMPGWSGPTIMPVRRLILAGGEGHGTVDAHMVYYVLPPTADTPVVGVSHFGDSGAYWLTGWFNGGFNDMDGTLLRMSIEALNMSTDTEALKRVLVEYQLDYEEEGAWTSLVNASGTGTSFSDNLQTLYFPNPDDPKRGVQFKSVRFRITLLRGDDQTQSPELKGLTLVYLKQPNLRTSWTFRIDINRMIEKSRTTTDTTYWIDGDPATMELIWSKLRELWDTHTLLPLVIPNVEPDGINVDITDMPLTFDDFREAVAGRGFLDLTVIEPVQR